ncbi:MAG: ribonuclease HI family protein [candidate division WOR-3 bacterium]
MGKNFIDKIEIYVDGCSKGNPGPSGAGIVIVYNDNVLFKDGYFLGDNLTNQDAEYFAVLIGLEKGCEFCRKKVEIKSDSQLVIKQLNYQFRIRKEKHKTIHEKIKSKALLYEDVMYIQVSESHKYIKMADKLANSAVNKVKRGGDV